MGGAIAPYTVQGSGLITTSDWGCRKWRRQIPRVISKTTADDRKREYELLSLISLEQTTDPDENLQPESKHREALRGGSHLRASTEALRGGSHAS